VRKIFFFSLLFTIVLQTGIPAQQLQTIYLKDQTVIRGEIQEMKGGVYTVKSGTLGTISVPAAQILSIVSYEVSGKLQSPKILEGKPGKNAATLEAKGMNSPTPKAPLQLPQDSQQPKSSEPRNLEPPEDPKIMQEKVNCRVKSMMMNQDFSEKVMNLNETDEMQSVLSDPETMNAIQSGDYESLMNNEKMKRLMESDGIKSLLGETETGE